jgi:hypothetical protein
MSCHGVSSIRSPSEADPQAHERPIEQDLLSGGKHAMEAQQPFRWEFQRGKEIVRVETSGRLTLTDVDTMVGVGLSVSAHDFDRRSNPSLVIRR